MASNKTSEAKAKIGLDSTSFEKGAKAVIDAANAMSAAVTAAFATAGVAILAALGAETVSSVVKSIKGVLDLGESLANAGKRAGLAAGQFYLFNAAVEKGLALKTVAGLIGENAEVLNRSASIFRDVSIKLWAIGEKIRGFWLGLMDRVAPVLSRILDGTLGASLVSAGQWFGDKIADAVKVIYQLAKDGKLWETLQLGLKVAFDYAGERLLWMGRIGYDILKVAFSRAVFGGLSEGVTEAWEGFKDFASRFADFFKAAFLGVWAKVSEVVDGFFNKIDKALNAVHLLSDDKLKSNQDDRATNAAKIAVPIVSAVGNFFKAGAGEGSLFEKIKDILANNQFKGSDALNEEIAKLGKVIPEALTSYTMDTSEHPTTSFENNSRRAAFGADSLTSIGGGGGVYLGLSVLDVNKAQLTELKSINMRLGALGTNSSLTVNNLQTGSLGVSRAQDSSVVND